MSAGVGDHHPVELEGEEGDTVVAHLCGPGPGQILAPRQAQMIGPEKTDTVVAGFTQKPASWSVRDTNES